MLTPRAIAPCYCCAPLLEIRCYWYWRFSQSFTPCVSIRLLGLSRVCRRRSLYFRED